MPPGYHGRYLKIDASSGRSELRAIGGETLRQFLGGVGLGTWILAKETAAGVDPLGHESVLVFALSPLVGSPLTTSAKFAVVAFSPLTRRVCDALSSSHFAVAAKRAGVDALAVIGCRDTPTVVFVDGKDRDVPAVTWTPAGTLWGLPAREAEDQIRAQHGSEWQVVAIGPAGERQIPFATLSHSGRHAGRGGLGAVLGSKQIKAIAVRGNQRAQVADSGRTVALAKHYSELSFGPATEKYRELGTVANLLVLNRFDALPTRNFDSSQFEGSARLSIAETPSRRVARESCASCTIGCEHLYAHKNHAAGIRLEYESLYALGSLCGVDDPDVVLEAAAACDRLGVDTITTGATIAFLMRCSAEGLLKEALLPSGRLLRFGDGHALLESIEVLGARRGLLGELLAAGSRRAAERIGGRAPDLAPHVKGLELPGYDPRSLHTMALGLAVGTRGADHNRSGSYEVDFSGKTDRRDGGPHSAALAIESEDRAAVMDSLILCKFLRGVFQHFYPEAAALIASVTGWPIDAPELASVGRRVVNARKCLNQREGWTYEEDTLPKMLLAPSGGDGRLTQERLDTMISAYYETREWDRQGRVPHALRTALGLADASFGAD